MRRFPLLAAASCALALAGCPSATPDTRTTPETTAETAPETTAPVEETVAAPARLPEDVSPTRYALTLAISPEQERFSGIAEIDVRLTRSTTRIWIHGQGLAVTEVSATRGSGDPIPGTWVQASEEDGIARIELERAIGPGNARLRIVYGAAFDRTLEGLYRVQVGDDHYGFTQFEAIAARKAFPCFDEPRFKTPFDVTLVAPSSGGAFANTRELEAEPAGEGVTRHRFATTAPLPTYLIAWAVGPLDVVEATIAPNAVRTRPLPLRGLAPRGRGPELAYAMEHTPRIVEALETWFGSPYPFDKLDIVAVPDFAAGAMENAGLVTFRDSLLLLSADAPVAQRRGFGFVMAHELAHQWFGNLVTMSWWDDLWLNEAFATWMETHTIVAVFPEFHAEVSELMTELEAFDTDQLASARQIRQPIETQHDISNAFDSITYSKGASVLMMIESWLGPDVFQRGIRRYLMEHAGGNATTADLIRALSAESGRDVGPVVDAFTQRPGIPEIAVTLECNAGARPRLALAQSRYQPLGGTPIASVPWSVPVCARYPVGRETRTACTLLTEASGALELEGDSCPAWVLPNAGGQGYYRFTLPAAQLTALSAVQDLSVRDRIIVADSVKAGFASGRIPFAAAMQTLAPFASSTDRFVATAPIELLVFARDHLLEPAQHAAFARYAMRLYQPQLRRLGWQVSRRAVRHGASAEEDGETRLLRASILGFLALEVRDPGVRAEAARRGRAYVGFGAADAGTVHADAVPTDLVRTALIVAAQEDGEPFVALLDRMLGESEDAILRGHLIAAVGGADDDAMRTRALDLTIDSRLRLNEVFSPMMSQFGDPDGQQPAWSWLTSHYDALSARLGPDYSGYLPFAASAFCSAERATEARAFFEPRVGATQGGPRNLESAIESVTLCAARVEAHRESARQLFAQ